jgi:hypothetical protein
LLGSFAAILHLGPIIAEKAAVYGRAQGIVGARSVLCAWRKEWSGSGTPQSPVRGAKRRECAPENKIIFFFIEQTPLLGYTLVEISGGFCVGRTPG